MYRVFLADDEPWVILGLKNMIDWGENGFLICGEADNGNKAWERISHVKPDLVISDIRMPGLSGVELISRIRESEMEMEVVFISGYSEFEYARAGLKYGCADYLLKPVYEEDLVSCLQKIKGKLDKGRGGEMPSVENTDQGGQLYVSEAQTVKEMLAYMRENYAQVTQQLLAEIFCMSVSAVSLNIKKVTGRNYSEHLLDIRMQKAEELLQTTNNSIADIAEQTGYNDYFYFIKVFKKCTGMSPSEFRKNL